jgi:hypothetical protein
MLSDQLPNLRLLRLPLLLLLPFRIELAVAGHLLRLRTIMPLLLLLALLLHFTALPLNLFMPLLFTLLKSITIHQTSVK